MSEISLLYQELLDLQPPWFVKDVVLREALHRVDVHLETMDGATFPCPVCSRSCPMCAVSPLQTWRYLDTCNRHTYLSARSPLVRCSQHGVLQPSLPWGESNSRVTRDFEFLIIRLAKECGHVSKVADLTGTEPDLVRQILRRSGGAGKKADARPAMESGIAPQDRGSQGARQLPLFGQDDMTLVNRGIQALKELEPAKSLEYFEKQQEVYPKGVKVDSRIAVARFLLDGFQRMPSEPCQRPTAMCLLWDALEDFMEAGGMVQDGLILDVRKSFFVRALQEVEKAGLPDSPFLSGNIPLGSLLLRAGRVEEAISKLQECIPLNPDSAALYGYLGDAYLLRGDLRLARQCYREACLIDPAGIDWRHLQDEDLKELKEDLLIECGLDANLALAWLPSHARLGRLFERKEVRVHDGLREMVADYRKLEKKLSRKKDPVNMARLFFLGMILCENEENLKLVKRIDLIQVRRTMKEIHPVLFKDFLEDIVEGDR